MPNAKCIRTVSAILIAVAAADAGAAARGHVDIEKQSWDVADAIAYRSGDELAVVLSDKPYDRAAFAKDGKLDDFDFIGHRMDKNASTLKLKFDSDLKLEGLEYSVHGGGGATNAGIDKAFTPSAKNGAAELAGTLAYNNGDNTANLTFDLPVESDKLQRPGKPLAADGGEPGKALLRHVAAIHSGNIDQLMAESPPEQRAEMQKAKASGEAKDMLPMIQSMTPKDIKLLGGVLDGDAAQVDFQGMLGGQPQKGTAELSRIGGVWYVTGMNLAAN